MEKCESNLEMSKGVAHQMRTFLFSSNRIILQHWTNSIGLFTFHAFRGIQHTQQLHPFSFLKFHVLEVIETSLSHHQELDNSHVWRRNRSCGDNSPVLLETEGMISEFHQSVITHRSCNSASIQKPPGLLSFESSTPPKAPKLNNPDYTPPS